MTASALKAGDKVRLAEFKRPFTVRAASDRFAVCTQPFNPRRTVIYTIVDFQRGIRGPENLVFGFGAETDEQCRAMLARLESGKTEVSHRRQVPLDIVTD
jgi:hypothetical protein